MRFDNTPHNFYRGIARHARTLSVCLLHQDGELLGHCTMTASPNALLRAIAPYREDIVSAVACLFGVAERCPAPAVRQSMEGDRTRIGYYDQLLREVE